MGGVAVSFKGTVIHVGDRDWTVDFPVEDVSLIDGTVVVLYQYMAGPMHHQFRNVEGFNVDGSKLWTAEHPTNETADVYVGFLAGQPLRLSNFSGFTCRIDPSTGRLLEATFTK